MKVQPIAEQVGGRRERAIRATFSESFAGVRIITDSNAIPRFLFSRLIHHLVFGTSADLRFRRASDSLNLGWLESVVTHEDLCCSKS